MTLRYFLNGTELTNVTVTGSPRRGALDGLVSSAFGGDIGTSAIVIDDPTGAIVIKGLQPFHVIEDACTPERIWTGYIAARRIALGDLVEGIGQGRQWDCDLMDGNFLLGLRVLRHPGSKRVAETAGARVSWLIDSTYMTTAGPGIFDNGFVDTANTAACDEADYFKQFPVNVLGSILWGGKTFFVYWDETAGQWSLFFGSHATGFGKHTVKLSNDDADIDGSTVFAAHDAEALTRDPQDVNTGVLYAFVGGDIFRERPATYADFGIYRDGVVDSSRIGRFATAESMAAAYLLEHSVERDVVVCTVHLLESQVNWFLEGYRVDAKFTHLPGWESYTEAMIEKRTVRQAPDSIDRYDVTLELHTVAPESVPGGGDPGDFPLPEPGPEHFYEVTITDSTPLGGPDVITDATTTCELQPDTLYNWFAEITDSAGVVGTSATPNILFDNAVGGHYVNTTWAAGTVSPALSGSFMTPSGVSNPAFARFQVIHNDVSISAASVHFYVDPDDWVTPDDPVPVPGQWVGISPPEYVTMVGTAGTTAFPFADGSLRVFYDNIDQTAAIVSYDGAAGTFVMAGAPLPGWQVRVEYQGR